MAADALLKVAKEHGFLYLEFDPFMDANDVAAMFRVGEDFFGMSYDEKMRWKIKGDYYSYKVGLWGRMDRISTGRQAHVELKQPDDEKISYKGIGATANDLPEGVQAQDNKGGLLRALDRG